MTSTRAIRTIQFFKDHRNLRSVFLFSSACFHRAAQRVLNLASFFCFVKRLSKLFWSFFQPNRLCPPTRLDDSSFTIHHFIRLSSDVVNFFRLSYHDSCLRSPPFSGADSQFSTLPLFVKRFLLFFSEKCRFYPPLTPAHDLPSLLIFSRLNGFFFPFFLRKRDFRVLFLCFFIRDILGEGMFLRCALLPLTRIPLRCALCLRRPAYSAGPKQVTDLHHYYGFAAGSSTGDPFIFHFRKKILSSKRNFSDSCFLSSGLKLWNLEIKEE